MFLYKLCLAFCTYTFIVTGSPFFTLIFALSGSFIFSLSYDSSASNNCSLLDNLYILSPIWMLPFILPITTFSPILAFEMFALFIISSETLYFVFSFSKFIVSPTERGWFSNIFICPFSLLYPATFPKYKPILFGFCLNISDLLAEFDKCPVENSPLLNTCFNCNMSFSSIVYSSLFNTLSMYFL